MAKSRSLKQKREHKHKTQQKQPMGMRDYEDRNDWIARRDKK